MQKHTKRQVKDNFKKDAFISDVSHRCLWVISALVNSRLEPVIWSCDTGQQMTWHTWTGGRTYEGTDVRTDGRRRNGSKTKISRIDRLPYFLKNGAPCARALGARSAPLLVCVPLKLQRTG